MAEKKKAWYQSKTKWAALFMALGPAFAIIANLLTGTIDIGTAINQALPVAGIVFGIFGIRDLPIVNRK